MDIASIRKARLRYGSFGGACANGCERCGADFSASQGVVAQTDPNYRASKVTRTSFSGLRRLLCWPRRRFRIQDYRFELKFSNGHSGVVDLEDRLDTPAFAVLKDQALFAQGHLDPEARTLVWPNEIDLAPEYLLFRTLPHAPELQERYVRWGYLPRPVAKSA